MIGAWIGDLFGVGFVSLFFVFVSKDVKRKSHEEFKGISRRGDK